MIEVKENVPLAQFTTFKVGGPARFFVEVSSVDEIIEAFEFVKEKGRGIFHFGGGANIIVNDKGFDGLIIKIKNKNEDYKMTEEGEKVRFECWAGDNLSKPVNFAAKNSLSGLEDLIGIPGTVGGAIRGNAGAYDLNEIGIAKFIESVNYIDMDSGAHKVKSILKKDCNFKYRHSIFKESSKYFIVSVVLSLEIGNKENIDAKTRTIIQKRIDQKPRGWVGSTGSFFKNPTVNEELIKDYEKETGKKAIEGVAVPAAWLISEVGLSGKKIGGVQVSEKNCNFLINTGEAKAEDVIMLASLIKQQVRDKMGVQLMEEVQYVGF